MQIVLGIDFEGDHAAQNLVKRLHFPNPNVNLTHVIPPTLWGPTGIYGGLPMEASLSYSDFIEMEREERLRAQAMLVGVTATFMAEEGTCSTNVLNGNPTDRLLAHADTTHADLIAVNAAHQDPFIAFMTGSVARGLVIGARQSVLLARGNRQEEFASRKPLRAVLATDHSPYMDRCVDQLLRFHPQGFQHLTVLSAYPEGDMNELRPYLTHLSVDPVEAMQKELAERNQCVIKRLSEGLPSGTTTFTSRVSGDPIHQAIAKAMEETEAELLIVGAQGHSFLQRLTLGSVSFRQAMTAPYSVLVLRVAPDAAETKLTPTNTEGIPMLPIVTD